MAAQGPEVIYVATWTTMAELGTPITPSDEDPQLTYNTETGCYEGEVIDWPKLMVNPYNAKIPYSVEGDVITYYGVAGPTQNFIFNTTDSQSFNFTSSIDPSTFKGFGLSTQNLQSVEDVKISMDLESSVITFTKFESAEGKEIPKFLSVSPENGGEITPDENGEAIITLTFSGEITSLEAVCDGSDLEVEPSEGGEVWVITVSAEKIKDVTAASQGKLALTVQKVYAGTLPVGFENGSDVLKLSYSVAGLTNEGILEFTGEEKGIETLNVYKYPEYSVGDEVEIDANPFLFTYTSGVTYLFTVGKDYQVVITSDIDSNEGTNWKLGEGYSTKKGPNGETTTEKAADGVTLSIYAGADGGVFNIEVVAKEAGIGSVISGNNFYKVYNLEGAHVLSTEDAGALQNLPKGIYIVNGKKIMIK